MAVFNGGSKFRKTRLSLLMCGMLSMCCTVQAVEAISDSGKTVLDPIQVEQVRNIGHSLLVTKRSVKPDPAIESMRQQVEEVHAALERLAEPLDGRLEPFRKNNSKSASNQVNNVVVAAEWKDARRDHIDKLTRSISQLKNKAESMPRHKLLTSNTQAINKNFIDANNKEATSVMSDAFIERISNLQKDVDDAMKLLPAARQERLLALSKEMKITSQPLLPLDVNEIETPTIQTRVKHRPLPVN